MGVEGGRVHPDVLRDRDGARRTRLARRESRNWVGPNQRRATQRVAFCVPSRRVANVSRACCVPALARGSCHELRAAPCIHRLTIRNATRGGRRDGL